MKSYKANIFNLQRFGQISDVGEEQSDRTTFVSKAYL